jgi:hypothetical protein
MKARYAVGLLTFSGIWLSEAFANEAAKDIIAAAVRGKGYQCESPKSAKPDPEHSSPGEKAWILECENRSYKVKFKGDQGAMVEPVGE